MMSPTVKYFCVRRLAMRRWACFAVLTWAMTAWLLPIQHEIQMRLADIRGKVDFKQLKECQIKKVILPVFHEDTGDWGLFFKNSLLKPLLPLLDEIAPAFAGSGVDLWAWMLGRKFNRPGFARYYDSEYVTARLRAIPKLDLFNPDAVRVLLLLYRELAQKGIGGIVIQDDFIIKGQEGFSNWGKARFNQVTGMAANEAAMLDRASTCGANWTRVKINQINDILKKIMAECRAATPGIKIAINGYYEEPQQVEQAEYWYSHNMLELLACGIDSFYLMAYPRQIQSELGLGAEKTRRFFVELVQKALAIAGERLVVKLQIRDWQTRERIPEAELQEFFQLLPAGLTTVCWTAVDLEDVPMLGRIIKSRSD